MPLPKRKRSKANRDMRRSNWKLKEPGMGVCPHCRKPKLSHRACPHCGYYKGRAVIPISEKKKK